MVGDRSRVMNPRFPEPDPHESIGMEPTGDTGEGAHGRVLGRPSAEIDRQSDAILDARPGILFVVTAG